MPGSFFDTNVLIYLASADVSKADRVDELVAQGGVVSVQVLNEVANVARRKMNLSWDETTQFLATLRSLVAVEPLTEETHVAGLRLSERYQLSVYDGLIAAAALLADCDVLWSEDMHDGLVVDQVLQIRNPFASA